MVGTLFLQDNRAYVDIPKDFLDLLGNPQKLAIYGELKQTDIILCDAEHILYSYDLYDTKMPHTGHLKFCDDIKTPHTERLELCDDILQILDIHPGEQLSIRVVQRKDSVPLIKLSKI